MKRRLLFSALFLLPVLFWLPNITRVPLAAGSSFSDLLISHLPNTLYLQQTLTQQHTIPLWSGQILSGYPFAADPLSGLHYPPGWLAMLLPLPVGINLVLILHLLWGGAGMYLFLRAQGLGQGAAIFGALSFEAMPKVFAHLGAGHVTFLYAVSLTPWLFLAECHAQRVGAWLPRLLPGVALGAILLADARWGAYAGISWFAYSHVGVNFRSGKSLGIRWLRLALDGALALLLAAPLLLPLLEYTRLSTRSLMTPADSLVFSLPAGYWISLIYPAVRGMAEWMLYPGAVACVLFLLALARKHIWKLAGFWMAAALLSLVLALGSGVPGMSLLYTLPGFDLLRVPARVLFLGGMAFAVTAAYMIHDLQGNPVPSSGQKKDRTGIILFAAAALVGLFGLAVVFLIPQPNLKIQFGWGALFFPLAAAAVFAAQKRRLPEDALLAVLLAVQMVDLLGVNALGLEFKNLDEIDPSARQAAAYLAARPNVGPFRVYSPSYSLPQQVAAEFGLEQAGGVDPLQLASYASYMAKASGVPAEGYSVTIPPFADGNPAEDNRSYMPDLHLLSLLNVRYLLAEYDLPNRELMLLETFGQTRVYLNQAALPRAWVKPDGDPLGEGALPVQAIHETANEVTIQAEGPGLLVLSEVDYPGWEVTVDGRPAQKETPVGLLRGVRLAAGDHTIQFQFRPVSLFIGGVIGLLAWVLVAVLAFFWRGQHA